MSDPSPTAPSASDHDNPWPGLATFTEDQAGLFHGRDAEIRDLTKRAERNALTVLFGQSGLGKSSLLQAGVFPRLRAAGYWPIYVRLDHGPGAPTPTEQIKSLVAADTARAGTWSKPGSAQPGESLWEFFHHRDDRLVGTNGRTVVPVLVFDQFEELFTLGAGAGAERARAVGFMCELAELVENRPSEQLVARLEESSAEMEVFDFSRTEYRVVITLREDFLPHLESLKAIMPALMENRMRLARMTGTQALEAVVKPGGALVTDEVARAIVEFVAGARGGSAERLAELDVEPPLLSVICRELNERRRALGQAQITAGLVSGNRREILHDFYERSVADLPAAMRAFVEDHLLTKSGFRDSLALETALEFPGVTPPLIDKLVARRILRTEDRAGIQRVELTHDVLAEVVRAARDDRNQRRELAASARQARRQRWIIAGLTAAVVGLLIGAFFGIRAQRRAEQAARDEAERSSRTDLIFGSQLLEQGKVPEGLGFLVRAARTNPGNSTVAPRLISALAYRAFALPTGHSFAHPAAARAIGFSDGGKRVITVAEDDALRVWDVATGELVAGPMKHEAMIVATDVSPDGARIAATCNDGKVYLWDAATGRPATAPLRHESASIAIKFSPDGRWLATGGSDGTAKLWDARTGELEATLDHGAGAYVSSVNFSPDSTRLVTTSFRKHQWRVWAVPSGEPLMPFSTSAKSFADYGKFSPDGKLIVICDGTGAELWDWAAGKKVGERMVATNRSFFAEFSADGSFVAITSSDGKAWLWEVPSGKARLKIDLPSAQELLAGITLSHDGRRLMVACSDGAARVYDTITGRLTMEPIRAGERIGAVLSPDDREIWTGNGAGLVRRWRADGAAAAPLALGTGGDGQWFRLSDDNSQVVIATLDGLEYRDPASGRATAPPVRFPVRIASVSGGGRNLESKSGILGIRTQNNDLELWDIRNPAAIMRRPLALNDGNPSFIFSDDQKRVAVRSSDFNEVKVWDTDTGRLLEGAYSTSTNAVSWVSFSPDNRLLAVARQPGTVTLWNLTTGQSVGDPMRHRIQVGSIIFSPDGTRLATGDVAGMVRLWDAATGRLLRSPLQIRDLAGQLAFSHDGRWLLIGGGFDTAAYIWDTQTGAMRTEPLRSTKKITGAVFNTEETRVVTASSDGSVRVWGARTGQLLVEPLRQETTQGIPWFTHDGRFVVSYRDETTKSTGAAVWAIPRTSTPAEVPDWMLRLATAVIGGEITAGGAFHEVPPPPDVFNQLKAELDALPTDAPFVKWGRWILADPATRTVSPEHEISAVEAEKLSGDTLATLNARDKLLIDQNKWADAEVIERQMLELTRGIDGGDVSGYLVKLAQTLLRLGKFAEAEALARESLALREKLAPVGSFPIAIARGMIGSALVGQKRYVEAEPLLLSALQDIKKLESERGLGVVELEQKTITVESLVQLYEAMNQPEKAAPLKQ